MIKKGIFITFEGGEGSGKTTLIEKVCQGLTCQGRKILRTRAPGGTELGREIRDLLLNKRGTTPLSTRAELLLFLADRAQHIEELILPALEKETIVLCDRFNDSTIAYQSGARGLPLAIVKKLCDFTCHGLQPDLTIYLDLDPKMGLVRHAKEGASPDRIEDETLSFHQNVRKAFKKIARKEPRRVILIDASQTPEEVYVAAKNTIDAILQPCRQ